MPPRKAAPGSRKAGSVTASPAKSTRSARSARGREDDEDSIASSYNDSSSRHVRGVGTMHLSNTSVNIANAFASAQASSSTSGYPAPPPRTLKPPPVIYPHQPPSPVDSNYRSPSPNAIPLPHDGRSTQDRLREAAKATSPVRYILQEAEEWDEGSSGYANTTGESYNYSREESMVRARMANGGGGGAGYGYANANGNRSGHGEVRRRRASGSGAREGDMPYRPAEDDSATSDSGGEGGGIVKSGALDGRAGTRGKRAVRGEGYLGNGLGLTQRNRPRRSRGETEYYGEEGEEEDEEDRSPDNGSPPDRDRGGEEDGTPMANRNLRAHHSPFSPRGRSATPVLDILRAKQPTTLQNVASTLFSLVTGTLRWVYDLLKTVLDALVVREAKWVWAGGKGAGKWIKENWWRIILALVALSLASRLRSSGIFGGPSGGYTAPQGLPGSMDEIVCRLGSLEKALHGLSASSAVLERASADAQRTDESLMCQIGKLESSVRGHRGSLDMIREESQDARRGLQVEVDALRDELAALKAKVSAHDSGISSAERARQTLAAVQTEVSALTSRVGSIEKDLRSALDDGRLRSALERILPQSMPVRKTPQGTLAIDPQFWTEMKKVFATHDNLSRDSPKAGAQGSRKDSEALDTWAEGWWSSKSSSGAFISREQFVEMLDREISGLRETIDALPRHSASASSGSGKPITIKSGKGDDLTGLFNDLIDAALLRYSKDTIARPDYALWSAGARVVPSVTSDTLVLSSPGTWGKWVLGKKDLEGRAPATALHPDNSVGSCWPFKGGKGQLGVLLNRRVKVTDITIEHAAGELALDTSTAPRHVEVWGLIDGKDNQEKVATWLAKRGDDAAGKANTESVLLADVTYDPSLPSHIQTFPIDAAVRDLDVDVGIVVFKVESNWGGDFTCLYRVRVHGEPA